MAEKFHIQKPIDVSSWQLFLVEDGAVQYTVCAISATEAIGLVNHVLEDEIGHDEFWASEIPYIESRNMTIVVDGEDETIKLSTAFNFAQGHSSILGCSEY